MRNAVVALTIVVVASACSGTSAPTTTSAPGLPTSAAPTTVSPPTTSPGPAVDPRALLEAFVAALNRDDVDAALRLVDASATWSIAGFDLVLDEPLPLELAWLAEAFGLAGDRTGRDVMEGFLMLQADLRTRRALSDCLTRENTVRCTYEASDALTALTGRAEEGDLVAAVQGGLLVDLVFNVQETTGGDRMDDRDAFLRWAYIENPDLSLQGDLLPQVELLLTLLDAWMALGRPDTAPPLGPDADPVDVVEAWLAARNDGDWSTHVGLLADAALEQELGSRDDFEAHGALERDIQLADCEVTLDTGSAGVVLSCVASVDDVITRVVGEPATNPNSTSLRVNQGRITSLPEFIPSHARAEMAIEAWAQADNADEFSTACPDGISNPFGTESATCARFVAGTVAEWAQLVREAYSP